MPNWSLEDCAIVLIIDKGAVGPALASLLGDAASDFSKAPEFTPDDSSAPDPGLANVPPADAAKLDAMGVENPPIKAVTDAEELVKRSKYYDAVSAAKASGK